MSTKDQTQKLLHIKTPYEMELDVCLYFFEIVIRGHFRNFKT